MIKMMGRVIRKDGMSVEDFQAYWRDVHGPLVLGGPGLRGYLQCHVLPELYDSPEPPAHDGMTQVWFNSLDAYRAARATPEWEAIAADTANFLRPGGGPEMFVTEVPILDHLRAARERQGMIKRMGFLLRKHDTTVEEFQRYWRRTHAPLVVESLPAMRRYVQAHPLPETYRSDRPPAFDGVAESWWDSLETDQLAPAIGEARPPSPAMADLANFARPTGASPLVTREVVILDPFDNGPAVAS